MHGIDFTVGAGERLALVGESGSGKTVTALSLLGLNLNAAVTGSALFHGRDGQPPRDLLKLTERELLGVRGREIAMIFQEPMTALNPLYTVGDQIAEVLQFKEGRTKRDAWKGAVEALHETGIPEPERRAFAYPHQLSGGQRQRAMIAMALAGRPKLLLADEPTTALDMSLRGQILDLLAGLQARNGMSMLIITHDLNLVRKFADRVAVLEDGVLVEQGRVEEVFSRPQHPYTRKLIDSRPERDVEEAPAVADAAPVMVARNVQVTYPVSLPGIKGWFRKGRFVAVKNASFIIAPGRTLGVVGESGSGKSTLALAALGLIPHGGELDVVGRRWGPHAGANKSIRRVVQVVFQDPFSSLSPRMVIEEIVGEGLEVHEPGLRCRPAPPARRRGAGRRRPDGAPVSRPVAPVSARVLRRPAPAPGDRAGADRAAATARPRRAHQRARRDHPEAGADTAAAAAARARAQLSTDHARSRRDPGDGTRRDGHAGR